MKLALIIASLLAVAVVWLLAWAVFTIGARQDEADELAAKAAEGDRDG